MSVLEFGSRFIQGKERAGQLRNPGVVVLEFGGGSCNKAGEASCRDFCAVPNGKFYDASLDPQPDMLVDQFRKVALLKPAVVSLVPNGEAVNTLQRSNTLWGEVQEQEKKGHLDKDQVQVFGQYFARKYRSDQIDTDRAMTPAEKMALNIALGKKAGLNISLTTNGSYLNKELIILYRGTGLETLNLSFHPNMPFNPNKFNPDLEHLIKVANTAIEIGIIPTITHVLTSQNADTFISLADYVTEHDIFFAVGIANARGGAFSTNNQSIEPSDQQVKMVFRRLLARKLFADRHIRTTLPYLLMAPFMRHWVCDQSTDFFHISVEEVAGKLQPKLNVCSEVRPEDGTIEIGDFIQKDGIDSKRYLDWREKVMSDSEHGCQSCTHQCYFESESRGTMGFGSNIERIDWWDTSGKALRQRYTFRHPIRPIVSKKRDFQTAYLWESLLQGIARSVAILANNEYWQNSLQRSGVDYSELVSSCIQDALDSTLISELIEMEKRDEQIKLWRIEEDLAKKRNPVFQPTAEWHDSMNWQSRVLRRLYIPFQRSFQEAGLTVPLKFSDILKHQSFEDFKGGIEVILAGKREKSIRKNNINLLEIISEAIFFIRGLIFQNKLKLFS